MNTCGESYVIWSLLLSRGVVGWERVGTAFSHLFLVWERVPTPFCTIVTLLEDLDFSFQLLCVADCEN